MKRSKIETTAFNSDSLLINPLENIDIIEKIMHFLSYPLPKGNQYKENNLSTEDAISTEDELYDIINENIQVLKKAMLISKSFKYTLDNLVFNYPEYMATIFSTVQIIALRNIKSYTAQMDALISNGKFPKLLEDLSQYELFDLIDENYLTTEIVTSALKKSKQTLTFDLTELDDTTLQIPHSDLEKLISAYNNFAMTLINDYTIINNSVVYIHYRNNSTIKVNLANKNLTFITPIFCLLEFLNNNVFDINTARLNSKSFIFYVTYEIKGKIHIKDTSHNISYQQLQEISTYYTDEELKQIVSMDLNVLHFLWEKIESHLFNPDEKPFMLKLAKINTLDKPHRDNICQIINWLYNYPYNELKEILPNLIDNPEIASKAYSLIWINRTKLDINSDDRNYLTSKIMSVDMDPQKLYALYKKGTLNTLIKALYAYNNKPFTIKLAFKTVIDKLINSSTKDLEILGEELKNYTNRNIPLLFLICCQYYPDTNINDIINASRKNLRFYGLSEDLKEYTFDQYINLISGPNHNTDNSISFAEAIYSPEDTPQKPNFRNMLGQPQRVQRVLF